MSTLPSLFYEEISITPQVLIYTWVSVVALFSVPLTYLSTSIKKSYAILTNVSLKHISILSRANILSLLLQIFFVNHGPLFQHIQNIPVDIH